MRDFRAIAPPFSRGPLTIERVAEVAGRSVLPVPFVRVRLADGVEIHLTERQAADYGRQLIAACIPAAPPRLSDIREPKMREQETEPRRA